MEEELVLLTREVRRAVQPEAVIARTWTSLGEVSGFREERSDTLRCGLGALPILRYGRFLFTQNHILNFFKLAFDLDFDLTPQERKESDLLSELCFSRLHPASIYAMWVDSSTSKDFFFASSTPWPLSFFELPCKKLWFLLEKLRVRAYLERQHRVLSTRDAFLLAEDAHRRLSQRLGDRNFFSSAKGRREYPRSLDIVVYAYLLEEIANLEGHPHVRESLEKYQNLKAFFVRMEKLVKQRNGTEFDVRFYDFFYVPVPGEEVEEFCTPKLSVNPKLRDPTFFEPERMKLETPEMKIKTASGTNTSVRQAYLTGSSLILLLYLYFR